MPGDRTMGERHAPAELHDEDWGAVIAVRTDRTTRGEARSLFTQEHECSFTEGRVLKTYYRFDAAWEAEQEADGIKEPYDGWPMFECRADADGAVAFWKFEAPDA